MEAEFINLTEKNIDSEHLCCIIRSKKPHPGVEAKREWLRERLKEGHVFRKLNVKGTAFIECAPLERAWVPVEGENYVYIYCLWVLGELKGRGYGKQLMEYCIREAKSGGRSGVCMLGAKKQKNWLSDQAFAKRYGFQTVDETEDGYELLALSFDGSVPRFTDGARRSELDAQELTIFYDRQCPFISQTIDRARQLCDAEGIPARFIEVCSLKQAKGLPCVFNNFAVFNRGRFVTVNLLDPTQLRKLAAK